MPLTVGPTVLLSVETASRELESKLVLAAALAGAGIRAIVGHKEAISAIAEQSTRVVWLGKSLFSLKSDEHLADRLLANQSLIMFASDEGAMHQADSWEAQTLFKHWVDYFREREVHRICAWGQRQNDLIAACAPELRGALSVTGCGRFDLCLPQYAWLGGSGYAAVELPAPPYILACTRFGAVAHAKGLHFPFESKLTAKAWPRALDSTTYRQYWFSKWRQDTHDLAEFMELIKAVARSYPQHTVVVRPHPSESLVFYEQAFSTIPNVVVRRVGNVLNWIMSAELVMHTNCTTGVEAVLAGRPVINFRPLSPDGKREDIEVACEAGVSASTTAQVLDYASDFLAGQFYSQIWSDRARSMLNNLNEVAIPRLVNETMAVLAENALDSSCVTLPERIRSRGISRLLVKPQNSDGYAADKRGTISAQHVEYVIDGCRSHGIGTGRVQAINHQYVVVEPA